MAVPLTDQGNSERLVAAHGKDLRYCPQIGRWLLWDGRRWAQDETNEVERCAKLTVRAMLAEAEQTQDPSDRRTLVKHQLASESLRAIHAMVDLARSEAPVVVTPAQLDADPWLLTVNNGTIDLRSGELHRHRRQDLITKLAPVDYIPAATAPVWDAFLDRVLDHKPELIDYAQRVCGYCLTGDTSEQVMFIPHGPGANGKSTFMETTKAILGDYAETTDPTTFLEKLHDGPSNGLARLMGARFVAAAEVGDGRRLAEPLVKSVTGGDTVTCRYLHREFFEYQPTYKILLATNHKPTIRGTDEAIWRRIRLLPFVVVIPPAERDPKLPARLMREGAGILAWMVRGCLLWQRAGLGNPDEVRQATEAYRDEMDVVGDFLAECCIEHPEAQVQIGALYQEYGAWCQRSGERQMSQKALGLRLEERGYPAARVATGRYRQGLGLMTHDAFSANKGFFQVSPRRDEVKEKHQNTRQDASRDIPVMVDSDLNDDEMAGWKA